MNDERDDDSFTGDGPIGSSPANSDGNGAGDRAGFDNGDGAGFDTDDDRHEGGQDTGHDGASDSDWRAGIGDGRVRAFAERFATPADAAKAAFELRQKLGRSVPAPDGSENEAFRNAIGVPASSADYDARFPEDLPDKIADAINSPDGEVRLARFLDVAHSAGFTQSQVDAALDWYGNELATAEGAVNTNQQREAETALADLRADLGGDFQHTLIAASQATATFGDPAFLDLLESAEIGGMKLGNHPAFIRTMAAVGAGMGEADPLIGGGERFAGGGDLDARHAALTTQMNDALDRGDHGTAERLDRQRTEISRQLVGNTPIVGTGARVV